MTDTKTYASTDYDGCDYITPGKMYEARITDFGDFCCSCDYGLLRCMDWNNCPHIKRNNWTRHTLTPSEAEAHNDKLEQSKALDELAELDSAEIADTPKTFGEWALLPVPTDDMPEDTLLVEYLYDEGGNPVAYRIKPADPVIEERVEWWGAADADDLVWVVTTYRDGVLTHVRLATDKETHTLEVEEPTQ